MNDRQNLEKKLSRLADVDDVYENGRRIISDGENIDILSAVLQEIDETVLHRKLTFFAGPNQEISLSVKGRRLLGVNHITPVTLIPAGSDLLGRSLSEDDAELIEVLAKVMAGFAYISQKLTVDVTETDGTHDYSSMGVAVKTLAASWSAHKIPEPTSALGRFLHACGIGQLSFILIADDTIIEDAGAADHIVQLKDHASPQINAIETAYHELDLKNTQNRLIIVDQKNDGDMSIGYARTKDQHALIMFDDEKLGTVLSAWHKNISSN